jgi:ABC-type sugar transport system ATPase subunit
VAIGKALAVPPLLLLLDEPFSNLDADLRWRLLDEIKRLHHHLHLTTVLVTHNIGEATYVADRVGVLSNGSILQLAPPHILFACPETLDVARLLYSPNFNLIVGEVVSRADGMTEFTPPDGLPRLQLLQYGIEANSQVSITWQPNDATLALNAAALPRTTTDYWILPAEVVALHFWEGRRLANLNAGTAALRVPVPYSMEIVTGTKVHVMVPKTSIVVFRQADGRRLRPQESLVI